MLTHENHPNAQIWAQVRFVHGTYGYINFMVHLPNSLTEFEWCVISIRPHTERGLITSTLSGQFLLEPRKLKFWGKSHLKQELNICCILRDKTIVIKKQSQRKGKRKNGVKNLRNSVKNCDLRGRKFVVCICMVYLLRFCNHFQSFL